MQRFYKILRITAYLLAFAGFIALLAFVSDKQAKLPFHELEINIDKSNDVYFVDEDDVKQLLKDKGHTVIGQPLSTINTYEVERLIDNDPSVLKSQVYKSIDGVLTVDVAQREPIARVINSRGESYYIDKVGKLMPLSNKFVSRILVVNGDMFESYARFYPFDFSKNEEQDTLLKYTKLDEIYKLATYINQDDFLKAQIEQVYVDKDFELIPMVGNHTIILGDVNDLTEKFDKLKIFYQKGLPNAGWKKYSTINLKYKGQVVCTKAINL